MSGTAQLIDGVQEYRDMRRALMALRLEVPPSIADDLTSRCERAALAIWDQAYRAALAQAKET